MRAKIKSLLGSLHPTSGKHLHQHLHPTSSKHLHQHLHSTSGKHLHQYLHPTSGKHLHQHFIFIPIQNWYWIPWIYTMYRQVSVWKQIYLVEGAYSRKIYKTKNTSSTNINMFWIRIELLICFNDFIHNIFHTLLLKFVRMVLIGCRM